MDKNLYIGMRNDARMEILDYLEQNEGFYLCDLHHFVFNEEPRFIYGDEAIKALDEEGIYQLFETIDEIIEYEKFQFGEVNAKFSNPCDVANMLWYIIGEEELYQMFEDCELFDELWDTDLSEEDCQNLIAWACEHGRY